jgi:hypothetical protein
MPPEAGALLFNHLEHLTNYLKVEETINGY